MISVLNTQFDDDSKGFYLVGFDANGNQMITDGAHDDIDGCRRAKKIYDGLNLPKRTEAVAYWRIIQILEVPAGDVPGINQDAIDTLNSIL